MRTVVPIGVGDQKSEELQRFAEKYVHSQKLDLK